DMGYCLKWCGRPQWCLSPIYAAGSFNTEELVEDPLFYLFVKPPMSSFELSPGYGSRSEIPAARCSYAGHVGPCFEPGRCKSHPFLPRSRAFVFADDLQRPAAWLENVKDSYMAQLLTHWAEPNAVDVVLLLPRPELARFPISAATRHELQRLHVQLQEVGWIRPELGRGIPKWVP
ncbi:unnamed protein product, partial [Durusdinium trenchii]